MDDLLGVVLCGGESRRMGRDKGLLCRGDRPWALHIGDRLREQQLEVVYSINERQQEAYSAIIPAGELVIDAGGWAGPSNGLFSVHRRFPRRDLLLVACDMPDVDAGTIGGLIAAYRGEGVGVDGAAGVERAAGVTADRADFFAYEAEGFLQPFCAIYTYTALTKAIERPQDGSLQGLLREGRVWRLPLTDPGAFRNYNTL